MRHALSRGARTCLPRRKTQRDLASAFSRIRLARTQKIGSTVGLAGSATYVSGTFTVKGAGGGIDGGGLLSGTSDGFHFVYQSLLGDGVVVARANNIQGENAGIQVGVMIRESLAAGATNTFVWYYPNQAFVSALRPTEQAGGFGQACSDGGGKTMRLD